MSTRSQAIDFLSQKEPNRVALNILSESLNTISVNPHVNHWTWTKFEAFYTYTFGMVIALIRLVPLVLFVIFSSIVAKITLLIIFIANRIGMDHHVQYIRKLGRNMAFMMIRFALFFAGFYWIRIVDKRTDKSRMAPIITAAPHSSFFDILLLFKLQNPTFVSRSENITMPLLGDVFKLCDGIFVERASKYSRVATIQAIIDRTKRGDQVFIFPEGTCTNRTTLIQFKLGAFLPRQPVQPVLLRFETGERDSVAWSWEGPSVPRLFIHSMTRLAINCQITILPEYQPNEQEQSNPQLFADNVAKVMCSELGILQSFYSYEDAALAGVAKVIRLFRSPLCIAMLKLASKIGEKYRHSSTSIERRHRQTNRPSADLFPGFSINLGALFHIGDAHVERSNMSEAYQPRNLTQSRRSLNSRDFRTEEFRTNENQYLPLSDTRRKLYKVIKAENGGVDGAKDLPPGKRQLCETFVRLIEHCVTSLESGFVYRPIESSEDIAALLRLDQFVDRQEGLALKGSPLFVDLVKMLELNVPEPLTTMHLLILLHLCDIREPDLWERIRVVVRLFDKMRQLDQTKQMPQGWMPAADIGIRPSDYMTKSQFRCFLWYSIGLAEFNDQFFVGNEFNFQYLEENLVRLFWRAVNENASPLVQRR